MNIEDLRDLWKDAEKDPPKANGYYWAYAPEAPHLTCRYQTLRYINGDWITCFKVTHWMDLPPKPLKKKESNEKS